MRFHEKAVLEDVSVVIPTLGREMLKGCLHAIASGSAWPARLIVVDQSSSARVAAWLDELRSSGLAVDYCPSSQTGVAAAVNRGLERVGTKFVAVTHDDCHPGGDWLRRLADVMRRNPELIVTGRVEPGGEGVVVSVITSTVPAKYTRPSLTKDVLFPNNMGFDMAILGRVGPFDERRFLRSAEDNDWSYRALRAKVPILYSPEVVVTHLDWRDTAELERTYRAYARSQGGFFGKHLKRGDLFIALRVLIAHARALRRWLGGTLTANSDDVANARAFLSQLLPGIAEGVRDA